VSVIVECDSINIEIPSSGVAEIDSFEGLSFIKRTVLDTED